MAGRVKHKRKPTADRATPYQWITQWADVWSPLLIAIIGRLIYANALGASFQFDDDVGIVNNPDVQQLSDLRRILTSGNPPRPLLMLTYAANYAWGQLDPFGYHVVNYAVHVVNAVLVYFIVQATFTQLMFQDSESPHRARLLALWSALFFVSHPIQIEAVTYIWGRSDVLSTGLCLASLWLFIKARAVSSQPSNGLISNRKRLAYDAGSLSAFMLALTVKETPIVWPLILLLYDVLFTSKDQSWKQRFRHAAPFLVIALARVVFQFTPLAWTTVRPFDRDSAFRLSADTPIGLDFYSNILTQCQALAHYVRLLFLPFRLNADHDLSVAQSIWQAPVILSIGLIAALIATAIVMARRSPVVAFCIGWFLISLAVFFVFPLPDLLVERRLYMTSVGFCLFLAVVIDDLSKRRLPSVSPRVPAAFGIMAPIIIVALYSTAAIQRNDVWKDPYTLWSDTVQKSPNKYRPHVNLAAASINLGRCQEAVTAARKAVSIAPGPDAQYNLLSAYCCAEDYQTALNEFRILLRMSPFSASRWYIASHSTLGDSQRLFNDVVFQFEKTVTASSPADEHIALGLMYLKIFDDRQKARIYLERGIERGPVQFRKPVLLRLIQELARG